MTSSRNHTSRRRQVALRLLAAAALTSVLGGCYQTQTAKNDYPFDYRDRHPITVREGARQVDVFLGRNRGGLTPAQRADVLAFAQWWKREANSGIVVQVPRGSQADRAAADSLREIHSIFAASGVPGKAVYVRTYRPEPASLVSIKIEYTKMVAEAGPCGQWPEDLGASDKHYMQNRPFWNFGCAAQRNLASMVDNPADLVQPRGEQPAYAARRSVALDKYRKGENPSGSYQNSSSGFDSGKISDIGK
ncbi:CpaD family pilus assembly protein [Undibacter mobilis]|uniref:Pilus assembly protein CpaD n=1 Tax=Undibacter mobilis TaxID=2292256 RepID=A0A371BDU0_9BRAD|nr:CpaD family pilus assembly protein [Undibacter mobilis]RDV05769.1 pilus assembly protein CpaD [Undibacter mobilis]